MGKSVWVEKVLRVMGRPNIARPEGVIALFAPPYPTLLGQPDYHRNNANQDGNKWIEDIDPIFFVHHHKLKLLFSKPQNKLPRQNKKYYSISRQNLIYFNKLKVNQVL